MQSGAAGTMHAGGISAGNHVGESPENGGLAVEFGAVE